MSQPLTQLKSRLGPILELYPSCAQSESDFERWLRAYENNVDKASAALSDYVQWRELKPQYGVQEGVSGITSSVVESETRSGKAIILGLDKEKRPLILVRAQFHDPNSTEFNLDTFTCFCIHTLSKAVEMMAPPTTSMTIIFDLDNITLNNLDMQAVKRLIYLLTKFYPERLGQCLILNAPIIFSTFWAGVSLLLAERTVQKMRFLEVFELKELIDESALPLSYGGTVEIA
ncbi:hypothetical protein CYMTET_10127 [Cymbomonas tetramitiformis]|uniref:CRAL-TRIO domain-containing protein n=1 Tax=Cymbomonas tetramitiformis TaxID=36881 RepID=A0AAE0LE52_9CHLO|nr:hypothetical protein CYMTET_10127 [Cymbomonas tetramitiformis]